MQLDRVRAPVRLARAYEALEEEFRYVVPRDCVRRRAFETRIALCTRGEGDVLEKRHDLDGRDPEPDEHRDERQAEPHHALPCFGVPGFFEREVEREQSGDDERVVGELKVPEQGQPSGRGQQWVALPAPVSQRQHQGQQDERQHRRREELAVVARRGVRRNQAGELVRQSSDHRSGPSDPQAPQEQVGEQAGKDVVQRETQVTGRRDRYDEAQQPGRIEDVPAARRHERHAAEDFRIPEREVATPLEPLGAPGVERQAGGVLIAPLAREPHPCEHGKRQEQRPQGEGGSRDQRGTTRFVGRRSDGDRGLRLTHWMDSCGRCRSGSVSKAAAASVSVRSTRDATLTATAPPLPRNGASSPTSTSSRTPTPPGANRASRPRMYPSVNAPIAVVSGRGASWMSPRASIHRAAPYVLQLSTVSRVPAKTAEGASGCNGAIGLTKRPSQTAVGRQTSTRIVARAARPARARRSGGALCGLTAATTATPLPSDTAWITNADAAAGPGATPARWASTTRPATLQTFPGT